jgi:endonuclease/exonuclease/phosphatase (EEP) superfamily protein YafD
VFAGDFNSWTQEHLDLATQLLAAAGFELAFSWPYPGRDFPLDHAFLRELTLTSSESFATHADHLAALLEVDGAVQERSLQEEGS